MRGYWNNEKDTKNVFMNGWFKTGDIGKMKGWIFSNC